MIEVTLTEPNATVEVDGDQILHHDRGLVIYKQNHVVFYVPHQRLACFRVVATDGETVPLEVRW